MTKNYIFERRFKILSVIKKNGRMTIKELENIFKKDDMTLRRDCQYLEGLGLVKHKNKYIEYQNYNGSVLQIGA